MAKATIQADVHDDRDSISIAAGTETQTKSVMVVLDDTDLSMEDTLAIETTLRRMADAVRLNTPIATA